MFSFLSFFFVHRPEEFELSNRDNCSGEHIPADMLPPSDSEEESDAVEMCNPNRQVVTYSNDDDDDDDDSD